MVTPTSNRQLRELLAANCSLLGPASQGRMLCWWCQGGREFVGFEVRRVTESLVVLVGGDTAPLK